jgi:hypothetical protein
MTLYGSTFRPAANPTSLIYRGNNDNHQVNPVVFSGQSLDSFTRSPKQGPLFQGNAASKFSEDNLTDPDLEQAIKDSLLTHQQEEKNRSRSSSRRGRAPSPISTHSHPSDTSRNQLENQNSSSLQVQSWITRLGKSIGIIKSNPTGEMPGTPVSFDRLYGNDLKAIYIDQRQHLKHCFLYSILKSICHHTDGKNILRSIKINEDEKNYYVKFPAQPAQKDFSTIPKTNLRNVVRSNSLGIQLIDLAYKRLPGVQPGEYDSAITAFVRIFGEHQIINIDTSRTKVRDITGDIADLGNITYHLGDALIPHSIIANVIETTLLNPYHDDFHIVLVARPHDNRAHDAKNANRYNFMANGHYLSFLDLNQRTEMATLGDSLGANESIVPLKELINNYDLEGMMIPKSLIRKCMLPNRGRSHSPIEQTKGGRSYKSSTSRVDGLVSRRNSTAHLETIPFSNLFGENTTAISRVPITQEWNSACHVAAPIRSILNHPQATEILNLIKYEFDKLKDIHHVTFPGQEAQQIKPAQLNNYKNIGVGLLNVGYLNLPGVYANRNGYTREALTQIFGDASQYGKGVLPVLPADEEIDRYTQLQKALKKGMYDVDSKVAYIATAKPMWKSKAPGRKHTNSIGGHDQAVYLTPDGQKLEVYNSTTDPSKTKFEYFSPNADSLREKFYPEIIKIKL